MGVGARASTRTARAVLAAGGPRRRALERRRLDARRRPDLRRRRPRAAGARSTGPSTPGAACAAACTSRGTATTRWPRRSPSSRAPTATAPRSCSRAARSTSTARAPCLTTEECLLNPNRNPAAGPRGGRAPPARPPRRRARRVARGRAWCEDETDGHVDNLACFTAPGVVALTWTDDRDDPQHARLRSTRGRGWRRAGARGRTCSTSPARWPSPRTRPAASTRSPGRSRARAGDRLAGSYVNFYVANDAVVVPLLDERRDDDALATIAAAVPGPPRRGRAGPRDPPRRRQRPLHHPAGPERAEPLRSRRADAEAGAARRGGPFAILAAVRGRSSVG